MQSSTQWAVCFLGEFTAISRCCPASVPSASVVCLLDKLISRYPELFPFVGVSYPKNITSMSHVRWWGLIQNKKGNHMGVNNTFSHLLHGLKQSPSERGIWYVLRWPGIWSHIRELSLLPGRPFWNNTSHVCNTRSFNEEWRGGSSFIDCMRAPLPLNTSYLPTKFWTKSAAYYKRRLERKRVGRGFDKRAHASSSLSFRFPRTWPNGLWCPMAQAKGAQACGGHWLHRSQACTHLLPKEHDQTLTQPCRHRSQMCALPSCEENPERAWPEEK